MNEQQLKFEFEGVLRTDQRWDLFDKSCQEASAIVVDLLLKDQHPILFTDIAAIRLRLDLGAPIPQSMHETFTTTVRQVRDERDRIKNYIEQTTEYRLVLIGPDGLSAMSGGYRTSVGFDLRSSVAGHQDNKIRAKLGIGMTAAALKRDPELVSDPELQTLLAAVQRSIPGDVL